MRSSIICPLIPLLASGCGLINALTSSDANRGDTGTSDGMSLAHDTDNQDGSGLSDSSGDTTPSDSAGDVLPSDSHGDKGRCDTPEACGQECTECTQPTSECGGEEAGCVAPQCADLPDFTRCVEQSVSDQSYAICVDGTCASPGCGAAVCNTPYPNFTLSDTSQRFCSDVTSIIVCPTMNDCATTPYCGQDAQYGWDRDNEGTDRFVGPDDAQDEPVVQDSVTGLMWQGCTNGLSGPACGNGTPDRKDWLRAVSHCDGLLWDGFSDWRLPDLFELQSIVDYGEGDPAVDPVAFAGTPSFMSWSSTTDAVNDGEAWYVGFYSGFSSTGPKVNTRDVRCVRGGSGPVGPPQERFTRIDATGAQPRVMDNATRLMWQGCPWGLSGGACTTGAVATRSWAVALDDCQDLDWGGHTDWYLPNITELHSLIDNRRYDPAIDNVAFPSTPSDYFFSSSSCVDDPGGAWGVHMLEGSINVVDKVSIKHVRCVRAAP
ncbi:DUF1566 domain-containing protein [Myxococcota bacterium]